MYIYKIKDSLTVSNIFSLLAIISTCYLLVMVVFNFMITRPTSTSKETTEIDSSNFPDVVACVDPPYKKEVLQKYGYSPWTYYRGGSIDDDFIGWNGLDGNQDSAAIMKEILSVSADEELIGEIYFQDKGGEKVFVKAKTRMLLYPQGRCLVIKPPFEKIKSFKYLYLKSFAPVKFNHSELPSLLKVFFIDPINDPLIYPMDIQIRGDRMEIPLNREISWYYFTVGVYRSFHVEGDPLFDCKEYKKESTYGDCVHQEMKDIFKEKLNCIPPGLANGKKDMCNKSYNKTKEESKEFFKPFWNHYYNFEPSKCKTPCTQTTYEVRLTSVTEDRMLGMKLTFEPIVHVTRSVFSSTIVDFLTRLGGSVSVLLRICGILVFWYFGHSICVQFYHS